MFFTRRPPNLFLLTIVLYTAVALFCIQQNGYFTSDDYQHFYKIAVLPFWSYLFTPIDHHVGPLHRIITYLIYKLVPLNYSVAVVILSIFHVAALWALYRLLNYLGPSPVNWLLLFLYAVNIYWADSLVWWCSGILRFPYILLTTLCIYHCCQYRGTSQAKHFWIALAACAVSFGFFSRSVLIPVYLIAVDICTAGSLSARRILKMGATVLPFLILSILYIVLYKTYMPAQNMTQDARLMGGFLGRSLAVLRHGLLALIYDPHGGVVNGVVLYCWVAFFISTVVGNPRNIMAWVIGLGCLSLHYLLVAVSPVGWFGMDAAQWPRYHADAVFIVVIFLKLIIDNARWETIRGLIPEGTGARQFLRALSAVFILGYAILSGLNQSRTVTAGFPYMAATKAYVAQLSSGLAELEANPHGDLAFVDGSVPGFVVLWCKYLAPYSKFLRIFGVEATYGVPAENCYTIDHEGNLRKVRGGGKLGPDLEVGP